MSDPKKYPDCLWNEGEKINWTKLLKELEGLADGDVFLEIKKWGVTITVQMIRENLIPGGWFNQEIMTYFIEWWKEIRNFIDPNPNLYFANTYLWEKLEQLHKEKEEAMQDPNNSRKKKKHQQTMNTINRWFKHHTRPAKIFVTVNRNGHWYLVVVEIEWDGSHIEIEVNDSFHCPQTYVANVILDWVKMYYSNQTGTEFTGRTNIMYRVGKQDEEEAPSPNEIVDPTYGQQQDGSSCGSWVCLGLSVLSLRGTMGFDQKSVRNFHAFLTDQIVSRANLQKVGKEEASTDATGLPKTYVEENGTVVIPSSSDDEADVNKRRKVIEGQLSYGGRPDAENPFPSDDGNSSQDDDNSSKND